MSDFSPVKLLFPSLSIQYSLEGSCYMQPISKEREKCSTSLRVEYLHTLFGIILYTFVSSSHINLFIFYSSMDSWIFFTLCNNQVLFYFFCSNCSSLAIRSSFSWLLCSFDILSSGMFVLFVGGTSSLSSTARCSRLILHMSCTSPRISHFSQEP